MTPQGPVGHIDADRFYCNAERVRDGSLVGVPLGVLGNGGACVIARSYEMTDAGVKTGEPIWDALKKCPDGIYLERDFAWYEVLSRAMLAVVREFSPLVEFHSVDESFFQAVPLRGKTFDETAVALRDRILEDVGVPTTVGIARSRTLAKLISDSAKPFGAKVVLDREAEEAFMAERPVTEITGIAGGRARRLEPWGIRTCLDLARADRKLVRELLTAAGEAIWWELNGDPVAAVLPKRRRHKALSRGGRFGQAIVDPNRLYAWLVRNVERLIEELEYHEMLAGRLTVWVGYKDGLGGVGKADLIVPADRFDLLLDAARPCLRLAWRRGVKAERMQLIAEDLSDRRERPMSLFDDPDSAARAEAIAKVKREINGKRGRFAVRSGQTLYLPNIYDDPKTYYDICDIRGKTCF